MYKSMRNSGGARGGSYESTGWYPKHWVKLTGIMENDKRSDLK